MSKFTWRINLSNLKAMFGFTVYENTIYYALVMADYYH